MGLLQFSASYSNFRVASENWSRAEIHQRPRVTARFLHLLQFLHFRRGSLVKSPEGVRKAPNRSEFTLGTVV